MTKESDIIFYQGEDGNIKIEVLFRDETFWMPQKKIAELFGVQRPAITKHLKNIFDSGELVENAVSSIMEHTAEDGKNYKTTFYSLDAIIAVGYRVNSNRATQFRIWATKTLKEFIIKGFVIDDERLKQGKHFGKDYFDELLERIREIRASERRFYQKVTDIYALSIDYSKSDHLTKAFFATVQNKLHWAISGKTAAEIIYTAADATKLYMGLTNWKHAPDGKILKSDVIVAKNYLNQQHIKELNRIVAAYLDLAENRAERQIPTSMEDWTTFLNQFLELSNYPILRDKGQISALEAKIKAEQEFDKYRIVQDKNYISDFDKEVKRIKGDGNYKEE
ncbi:virulence RhuM family protein [Geofilum rubicundum]|uniref:DNA-binding protein n=1 Tax=Geofilum rubicundum JCM 15548 TaxID=1236989 RepID=A0A0E9LXE1_9BACT|nr:virulence RhuM family protein [Geofilum rubicundum]GAO29958.1 DNA-binding protein [Geofilum rubicundum JCM 15548]